METTINERIKIITEQFFNGNTSAMARSVFVKQATLRDIISEKAKPSFDTIKQIVECSTLSINSDWLITGNGEMLKSPIPSSGDSVIAGRNAIGNNSNITGGIQGHSVKNGNITGDYNNVGIMPSDCERSLIKAKAEIDVLKKKLKESEAKIKDIEARCKEEKEILNKMLDQAVLDKERAMNMLEKALDK